MGSEKGDPKICCVVLNDDISTHSSGAQMMTTQAMSAMCAMVATVRSVKNDGLDERSMRGGRDLAQVDRRAIGFALLTAVTICAYLVVDGVGGYRADADLALEARDLAGYQENVEAAKALINKALEQLTAGG